MWLEKMDFGINGGGDIVLALMIDRERGRQAKRKTEADGAPRNSVSRADRSMTACAIRHGQGPAGWAQRCAPPDAAGTRARNSVSARRGRAAPDDGV